MKRFIAVAATVLALASAASAEASGITAGYVSGTGYCWNNAMAGSGNRIVATAPIIDAAQIATIGAGGSQLVGFRVTLERWNETDRRWVPSSYSPIKVHPQGWGAFYSDVWYDGKTGAQVKGLSQFLIFASGYYRVAYDLLWYADNGVLTGHVSTLSESLQDYRPYTPVIVDWCRY